MGSLRTAPVIRAMALFLSIFLGTLSHSSASMDDLNGYAARGLRPDVEAIAMVARAVEEVSLRIIKTREELVIATEVGSDTRNLKWKIPLLEEVLRDHRRVLKSMADEITRRKGGDVPVWLKGTLAMVMDKRDEVGDPQFFVKKKRRSMREKLVSEIEGSDVAPWLSLGDDPHELVVYLELPVIFSSGASKVTGEYRATLRRVAGVLKGYRPVVVVTGVTDARKADRLFALSAQRATNVAREFVDAGIASDAFSIQTRREVQGMERVEVSFRIAPDASPAAG